MTWEELRRLPDRTPIYKDVDGQPYACVLRWDFEQRRPRIWKRGP